MDLELPQGGVRQGCLTRGASASPKILICQKFGQNPKKFGTEVSTSFNNINEITLVCCWVYESNSEKKVWFKQKKVCH